jgi:ferredoxin-nitrite reductase
MTRLRFPCGIITSAQCRAVADIADTWGAGHVDITTRANLQIRELGAASAVEVINALTEAGILNRGSGADNLRNITGSATAGIDSQELYDTRPLCREMHHYILQHREMYGLPRKFNIAFDGGGIISALADTNDIGFMAVRVPDGEAVPAGVYFRMELGGITGHLDFARDTGVLLRPEECVPVAAAVVRVFIGEGDRTDRKRARLKYVLDRLGHDVYLQKTEALLGRPLTRFPLERCQQRGAENRFAHVGVHAQVQPGLVYVGLVLPVGRLTTEQLRRLAKLADRYGSGTLRLTVWQNLLLPDIPRDDLPAVQREVEAMGLHWSATAVRAGLIACTGAAGCKFAAAHTKQHALEIAEHLEAHVTLDQPVNIHLTGCHHSCAQHYIGDLGLLGTKVPQGDEMVEGYHIYSGGGYGAEQGVGRELYRNVLASDAPNCVLRIVRAYLAQRLGPSESLRDYLRRFSVEELRQHAEQFEEQLT